MNRSRPPPRVPPPRGNRTPRRNNYGNWALGAGALLVLPSFISGLFGGGGGGGVVGGVGDIIQLIPVLMVGGGALYAFSVFKK